MFHPVNDQSLMELLSMYNLVFSAVTQNTFIGTSDCFNTSLCLYLLLLGISNQQKSIDFFSKYVNTRSHYKALLFREVGQLSILHFAGNTIKEVSCCLLYFAWAFYSTLLIDVGMPPCSGYINNIVLFPSKISFFPSFGLDELFLWCRNKSSWLGCICDP